MSAQIANKYDLLKILESDAITGNYTIKCGLSIASKPTNPFIYRESSDGSNYTFIILTPHTFCLPSFEYVAQDNNGLYKYSSKSSNQRFRGSNDQSLIPLEKIPRIENVEPKNISLIVTFPNEKDKEIGDLFPYIAKINFQNPDYLFQLQFVIFSAIQTPFPYLFHGKVELPQKTTKYYAEFRFPVINENSSIKYDPEIYEYIRDSIYAHLFFINKPIIIHNARQIVKNKQLSDRDAILHVALSPFLRFPSLAQLAANNGSRLLMFYIKTPNMRSCDISYISYKFSSVMAGICKPFQLPTVISIDLAKPKDFNEISEVISRLPQPGNKSKTKSGSKTKTKTKTKTKPKPKTKTKTKTKTNTETETETQPQPPLDAKKTIIPGWLPKFIVPGCNERPLSTLMTGYPLLGMIKDWHKKKLFHSTILNSLNNEIRKYCQIKDYRIVVIADIGQRKSVSDVTYNFSHKLVPDGPPGSVIYDFAIWKNNSFLDYTENSPSDIYSPQNNPNDGNSFIFLPLQIHTKDRNSLFSNALVLATAFELYAVIVIPVSFPFNTFIDIFEYAIFNYAHLTGREKKASLATGKRIYLQFEEGTQTHVAEYYLRVFKDRFANFESIGSRQSDPDPVGFVIGKAIPEDFGTASQTCKKTFEQIQSSLAETLSSFYVVNVYDQYIDMPIFPENC